MPPTKKEPTDEQIKELFKIDVSGLDKSNEKKLVAVQRTVIAAAKEFRSLFPGESGNVMPIVTSLRTSLDMAKQVVLRRAGVVTLPAPAASLSPPDPTDGNTEGVAKVEGASGPLVPDGEKKGAEGDHVGSGAKGAEKVAGGEKAKH